MTTRRVTDHTSIVASPTGARRDVDPPRRGTSTDVSGAVAPRAVDLQAAGYGAGGEPRSTDELIAGLAAEQHGVVARWQLIERGITAAEIDHRRRRCRLHAAHPAMAGVYLVGHTAAPDLALETAALLLCRGRPAALSRWSAAMLHGFADRRSRVDLVQVGGRAPRSPAVSGSAVATLPAWQVVRRRGLWVTTPARTFLDLSAIAPVGDVERCLDRARILRIVSDADLEAVLAWAAGRRGARPLADLLAAERDGGYSRSRAERRLLRLLALAGLPAPVRNAGIHGRERDLAWASARTVVEFDGRGTHLTPKRWEQDNDRDGALLAHGWRTFRVTWTMLCSRPYEVVARAAAILALAERDADIARSRLSGA